MFQRGAIAPSSPPLVPPLVFSGLCSTLLRALVNIHNMSAPVSFLLGSIGCLCHSMWQLKTSHAIENMFAGGAISH